MKIPLFGLTIEGAALTIAGVMVASVAVLGLIWAALGYVI